MRLASKASIFKQKQIILRAKRASTPQELSKFGAKRQFFASAFEKSIMAAKTAIRSGLSWLERIEFRNSIA